jgi:hypothetical protein
MTEAPLSHLRVVDLAVLTRVLGLLASEVEQLIAERICH